MGLLVTMLAESSQAKLVFEVFQSQIQNEVAVCLAKKKLIKSLIFFFSSNFNSNNLLGQQLVKLET